MRQEAQGILVLGVLAASSVLLFLRWRNSDFEPTSRPPPPRTNTTLRRASHIRRPGRYAPSNRPAGTRPAEAGPTDSDEGLEADINGAPTVALTDLAESTLNSDDNDQLAAVHPSPSPPLPLSPAGGLGTCSTDGDTAEILDGPSVLSDWTIPLETVKDERVRNFLYAVAEDLDVRQGFIHTGITCNHCRRMPIRGLRYHCANCANYDLCEDCEAENLHDSHHVFLKIRIPIPAVVAPRAPLLVPFYPNRAASVRPLTMPVLANIQQHTHMFRNEILALHEQFKVLATDRGDLEGIDADTFYTLLGPCGVERPLLAQRVFMMFDRDKDGVLSFEEMVFAVYLSKHAPPAQRIPLIFQGYDVDGDGFISRDDLTKIIESFVRIHNATLRDMILSVEGMVLGTKQLAPTQPVSAAFTTALQDHMEHLRQRPTVDQAVDEAREVGRLPILPQEQPIGSREGTTPWPVVEAINHTAVRCLVDSVFVGINPRRPDHIAADEFRRHCQSDDRLLAWFEVFSPPF